MEAGVKSGLLLHYNEVGFGWRGGRERPRMQSY